MRQIRSLPSTWKSTKINPIQADRKPL